MTEQAEQKPIANATEVAMYLCDRDGKGVLSENGMFVTYTRETGTRMTPEVRQQALSLYHSWLAEQGIH